jgi:hypothetical protein
MFKSITAVAVSAAALLIVRQPSAVDASAAAGGASAARSSIPRTAPGDVLGGFVENRGQWHSDARFAARFGRAWTFVTNEGLRVATPDTYGRAGAAVFLTFDGARPAEVRGESAKSGRFNFFRGGDPAAWRADVPVFERVRMVGAWRGVDVLVRERDGRLAYDVELAPGAKLSDVVVRVEGADALRVENDGVLVVDTAAGPLRQSEPVAWRTGRDGARTPVRVAFRTLGSDRFGFSAEGDEGDASDPLTVDPSLDWCGFVGGNNLDEIYAVDVDPTGAVYLGGRSASPDFPVTPGAFDISGTTGNFDAVVVKFDPASSTLVYGSFFGGSGTDRVEALCVNAAGEAHFTGQGGSGWPTTPGAFDTTYGGQADMYAAKLSADGSTLAFSTFVGGNAEERGHAIALDAAGAVYVAGQTLSTTSYPTTSSAILATSDSANTWNACLTKVNPSGATLGFSVKFGGAASEWIYGLRVDAAGAAYVSGATSSANFFTTPGALNLVGVSLDTFVAKINPSGASYAWCARVGGPGVDQSFGGALGADGTYYAVGVAGVGFPTTVGAHRTVGDGGDGFAYRLAANGASLLYSTYLGGSSTDQANCAALDAFGRLYVGGYTNSTDLPVPYAIDPTFNGGGATADGFVTKLSPNGASLAYGSYFGGAVDDNVLAMRLASNGVLWIAGTTLSPEIAAGGGFGQTPGAAYDGFAAKMTLPKSAGAVPFGTGVGVGPAPTLVCSEPIFESAALASGGSAPPNAVGLLSLSAEIAPLDLGGGYLLYGDPYAALPIAFPVPDAGGAWSAELPYVPFVPALEGVSLALQVFFLEPAAPLGFVASNAVRLTFGF